MWIWNLAAGIVLGMATQVAFQAPYILVDPDTFHAGEWDTFLRDITQCRPGAIVRVPERAYIRWMPAGNAPFKPPLLRLVKPLRPGPTSEA